MTMVPRIQARRLPQARPAMPMPPMGALRKTKQALRAALLTLMRSMTKKGVRVSPMARRALVAAKRMPRTGQVQQRMER